PVASYQAPVVSRQPPAASHKAPIVGQAPVVSQQAPVVGREPAATSPQSNARPAPQDRRPATDNRRATTDSPTLPLLNTEVETDLPISEISAAEEERFWDAATVPAIVVPDAGPSTTASRSYLDYVRGEPSHIDHGIREPLVAEPVAVREA